MRAIEKVSRYESLEDVEETLKQTIKNQDNPVLLKLGSEILGRIEKSSSVSIQLLTLKQMGELMKAVSTLVKYMFSRVQDFHIPDNRSPDERQNKLDYYLARATEKAEGLIRAKERFTLFEIADDSIDFNTLCSLMAPIDMLYQEICLSFRNNCPMPELGPEEDTERLLTQINFAEQWLRKYAIKEGIFMFTDLDKSTMEFARLNPVEIAKIIQWYSDSMKDIITQFGGEIRKAEGDGNFVMFKDQKSALVVAVTILQKVSKVVEDLTLLPMCIGICRGTYLETGVARRNELGSKINWAKKLASLDPPGLYITEDILDTAKELGINYEVQPVPDAFKLLGQKVLSVHWNLVSPKEIIK